VVLWVVREQEQEHGGEGRRSGDVHVSVMTRSQSGPTYTTLALARAAVAMRLRNLYGGGDCFVAPCPAGLFVQQRWQADGTGMDAPVGESAGG
jgi:hypothetical protein